MTVTLLPVEPTLTCWSGLRPIPKGSLEHRGNGVLRESNPRSKPHKEHLIGELLKARLMHKRRREFPLRCPVEVTIAFFFVAANEKGKFGPLDRPSTTATGDIDKLERLVLDSLTQSEVIADDCQVVGLVGTAWFGDRAGTQVTVGPARGNDGQVLTTGWPS